MFFTGDFNAHSQFCLSEGNTMPEAAHSQFWWSEGNTTPEGAHSQFWWSEGNTMPEGEAIEDLFTSLGLQQLICEATNFEPNKHPTCIDLVVTGQPNLVLDSGTRPSFDSFCHHQIIHCKVNFRILPPPLYERKM